MTHKTVIFSLSAQLGLSMFFLLGFLIVSLLLLFLDLSVGLILIGLVLALTWTVICFKWPLPAFFAVLVVFVLAYSRLGFGFIDVEGPGNRGVIALGDLLWFGLILGCFFRRVSSRRFIYIRLSYFPPIWLMFPFVAMATALPLIGVLIKDWPLSYAVPGLRQLQWASFGVLAYRFCMKYGGGRVLKGVIAIIVIAGFAHMVYGLIQLGYFLGFIDRAWIYLDDFFASQNDTSWFFYPRLTGLLVNPNSYGLYGAFLFATALALALTRAFNYKRIFWWLIVLCAVFSLVFSASRSALLGLITMLIVLSFLSIFKHRLLLRFIILSTSVSVVGVLVIMFMWHFLPATLQGRFLRFFDVFALGASADVNALARVEEWRWLWNVYLRDFPFGTWVPASYATGSAVDSFYLMTAVQGTPVFTLVWLVFLVAAICLGWRAYSCARNSLEASSGLTVAAWAGIMAGGALTLSPMLEPQLIVPFWVFIGVTMAIVRKAQESSCAKRLI